MKRLQSKHRILLIIVPLTVFLDQLTKVLAKAYLDPMRMALERSERYVTVIDGFFRLKYAENPGAAFGTAAGGEQEETGGDGAGDHGGPRRCGWGNPDSTAAG